MANFTTTGSDTYPTGHIIQTKWSLFAGSTAFNDNHDPDGVNITSVAITLSAGSDVVIFGLAEHERLSATTNHVTQTCRLYRSTTLLATNETSFPSHEDLNKGVQSINWVDVGVTASGGSYTYYLNMNNPSNNMQCNHAHIILMEVV